LVVGSIPTAGTNDSETCGALAAVSFGAVSVEVFAGWRQRHEDRSSGRAAMSRLLIQHRIEPEE
jgi:hypothetical protein